MQFRRQVAAVAAGVLATAGMAFAQGAPGTITPHNRMVQDLNILVQANLKEAGTLRRSLPALKSNPRAVRVWRHMIADHSNGAQMLAKIDSKAGGNPDLSRPTPEPLQGGAADIIKQTLRGHRDTLSMVRNMEAHARGSERTVLRKVEGVVRGHISMLEALQNGGGSMGGHSRMSHRRRRSRRM